MATYNKGDKVKVTWKPATGDAMVRTGEVADVIDDKTYAVDIGLGFAVIYADHEMAPADTQ